MIGVGIAASFLIVTLLIVLLLILCYWNRIKKLVMSGLFTICTHYVALHYLCIEEEGKSQKLLCTLVEVYQQIQIQIWYVP